MLAPVPIDAPSVWMPGDFADDSAWSFRLTNDERSALIECGRTGSVATLDHRIAASVTRWTHLLIDGPGFVRVRDFPIDALDQHEVEVAYLALGALLGRPVGQDRHANLITHIRDERIRQDGTVRRYQTNLSQGFHNDASDLVGLLSLHPARSGGKSRIVSAHAVYNEALDRDRTALASLYLPLPWSRTSGEHSGNASYFQLAPLTDVAGIPRMFFIPWYIRGSQDHPDAPRLTEDQHRAVSLIEQIANDPAFQIEMHFASGDLQLLNNATVLHARDAYTDEDDPSRRRHLLRLWLSTDTAVGDELLPTSRR